MLKFQINLRTLFSPITPVNLINSVILRARMIQIKSNLTRFPWAAHLAVCRRNAACNFVLVITRITVVKVIMLCRY
jgi:hypothetical protein